MRFLAPALALILASGCGGGPKEPTRPAKGDVTAEMGDHFAAIVRVQKAVTRGELETAKRHAGEFTTHLRNADHPESWRPYLQDVRTALFGVVGAADLDRAAVGTARAGRACGACHAALGIETMPAGSKPPVEKPESLSEYMWQHMWASESMWNGLVGPSSSSWKEGADALARAGMFPKSSELSAEMQALAAQLNTLGQQAIHVEGLDERAKLYGNFLAACAGCHKLFIKDVD